MLSPALLYARAELRDILSVCFLGQLRTLEELFLFPRFNWMNSPVITDDVLIYDGIHMAVAKDQGTKAMGLFLFFQSFIFFLGQGF